MTYWCTQGRKSFSFAPYLISQDVEWHGLITLSHSILSSLSRVSTWTMMCIDVSIRKAMHSFNSLFSSSSSCLLMFGPWSCELLRSPISQCWRSLCDLQVWRLEIQCESYALWNRCGRQGYKGRNGRRFGVLGSFEFQTSQTNEEMDFSEMLRYQILLLNSVKSDGGEKYRQKWHFPSNFTLPSASELIWLLTCSVAQFNSNVNMMLWQEAEIWKLNVSFLFY